MKESLRARDATRTEKGLQLLLVYACSPHFRREQHTSYFIDASDVVKSCLAVIISDTAIGAGQTVLRMWCRRMAHAKPSSLQSSSFYNPYLRLTFTFRALPLQKRTGDVDEGL